MVDFVKVSQRDQRLTIRTSGLDAFGNPEISVNISEALVDESEAFLKYVSDYLLFSGKRIEPGETMAYGYWLVKFQEVDRQDYLETWEYEADASVFIKGADLTLCYWKDQHLVCDQHGAAFSPPRPDKLTVVSAGVMEGLPVQGIRYPSPDQMSGWWLTTDLYDGDVKTLHHEHTYHVTAARPDLVKYLALPTGFRFNFSAADEVWFDEKVLQKL